MTNTRPKLAVQGEKLIRAYKLALRANLKGQGQQQAPLMGHVNMQAKIVPEWSIMTGGYPLRNLLISLPWPKDSIKDAGPFSR